MKIAILNTQVFFVRGGAEILADSLKTQFERRGHEAEVIRIPFKWYPAESILRHMFAARMIKLDPDSMDLVIGLKFPAYYVPFPRKKLWLLHQFRQVYDLWGTRYQDLPDTPDGQRVRDLIIQADNRFIPEANQIYTNSKIVASRLKRFNNINADGVLYPPLSNPEQFRGENAEDYFFYPSRITAGKRQHMAVEAMRHTKSNFRLVLAGKADSDSEDRALRAKIDEYDLKDRVLMTGYISDQQKAALMSRAVACLYLPYDEDSYGYVTLEAFQSRKPVITFTDSGGTDEIMEHGVNGLVVEPSPESLADAMEALWANPARTTEMGLQAFESLKKHNIDWDYVVEKLLS